MAKPSQQKKADGVADASNESETVGLDRTSSGRGTRKDGKPDRRRREHKDRTPEQLDRQARAFDMKVLYKVSTERIAKELSVDRKTILNDIREEHRLRGQEMSDDRAQHIRESIAVYESVIQRMQPLLRSPLRGPAAANAIAKAQERIDKIRGVDAAIRIGGHDGGPIRTESTVNVSDSLKPLSTEELRALIAME
jgi:hypothetical protein